MGLNELGREIARLWPNGEWCRPGMAARDPQTGYKWRRIAGADWICETKRGEESLYPSRFEAIARLIANGPDIDDDTTALALLQLLPDADLQQEFGYADAEGSSRWYVNTKRDENGEVCE